MFGASFETLEIAKQFQVYAEKFMTVKVTIHKIDERFVADVKFNYYPVSQHSMGRLEMAAAIASGDKEWLYND